jgi:hypothetical protein
LCCVKVGVVYRRSLFGKRPSPYYGKNSLNKQREMTVHHYFKTCSVNKEHFKKLKKLLQVQSQKPSRAMMKLALKRTATGKEDPELTLLQRKSRVNYLTRVN